MLWILGCINEKDLIEHGAYVCLKAVLWNEVYIVLKRSSVEGLAFNALHLGDQVLIIWTWTYRAVLPGNVRRGWMILRVFGRAWSVPTVFYSMTTRDLRRTNWSGIRLHRLTQMWAICHLPATLKCTHSNLCVWRRAGRAVHQSRAYRCARRSQNTSYDLTF